MCFKYCISLNFRPSIMEFSTRHLALCNRIYLSGCSQLKQVGTKSNQLDLVPVHHDLKGIAWLVTSLQIRNSNNADVLLNSGHNLFDIMANLCSKLCCEVLLKSWRLYCASIEVDFCFGLQQERLCKTDLSGLKLSVSIANPCSKLLHTEVKGIGSSI